MGDCVNFFFFFLSLWLMSFLAYLLSVHVNESLIDFFFIPVLGHLNRTQFV